MAKDPAFLFYPGDWLGGTLGMTFEQKGAYMELLMLQFNRGHMTKHMMAHTVGQLLDGILDKFEKDTHGKYYNKRLDIEKEKRKSFTNSRFNNLQGKNQYSKNEGHMTSHMENENLIYNILYKVLESNDKLIGETDLKDLSMIVKEMLAVWLKYKPHYQVIVDVDYHSLLQIAYHIAERKGWRKHEVIKVGIVNWNCAESWEKIVQWLTAEKNSEYYKTMPLDKVSTPKGFRDIEERMKTTNVLADQKLKKLETERIDQETYMNGTI